MKPAEIKKTDPKRGQSLIEMKLDLEWKKVWTERLQDLKIPGEEEVIRAYSPADGIVWTFYLKLAEEGIPGKALLAHPEEDQYVGTIRVTPAQREKWLARLEDDSDVGSYRLSKEAPFSVPSNLDLEWKFQ